MNQADASKDRDPAVSRKREAQAAQVDPTETTQPMPLQDESGPPGSPARGTGRTTVDVPVDD